MSPPITADRPAIAEVNAGDLITIADDRLPLVAIVRHIDTGPANRTLHLEVPGFPQCTWAVPYDLTERVERHACPGRAA